MTLNEAPLFSDVAKGPKGGAAVWVKTSDAVRIRVAHWTPQSAKGTVLLFPGRTEYIEKYGPIAADLYERGLATCVIDWRGQGLAARLLPEPRIGHIHRFGDYQQDVAAMLDAARTLDLPRPFYLLAHSMGGAIGLRAVMDGLPVKAAVFSAPMWGIQMATAMRPVAWAISWSIHLVGQGNRLSPNTNLDAYVLKQPFEGNQLTSDRGMYDFMVGQLKAHPELTLGGPSLTWLQEALRDTRELARRAAPDMPCLTWLGSNERIVDPARIQNRMNAWPGGTLAILEGKEHEVLMESPALRTRLLDDAAHFYADASRNGLPKRSA
jgi:lysophospholipase